MHRNRMLMLLLCFQSLSICCCAQKPEDILKSDLVGKQLVLRNFSGASEIHGSWDGQTANLDLPPWRIYAVLTPNSVRLKGSEVRIEGERRQIVHDKAGNPKLVDKATNVDVRVKLIGDPAVLALTFRNKFFFSELNDALTFVPKEFREAPGEHTVAGSPNISPDRCDCADEKGHCLSVNTPGFNAPKLLSTFEPTITEEAKRLSISGEVFVGIHISGAGDISEEWLIEGLGYGLDEEALSAVRRYKFGPANCHGTPVGTNVGISVNFKLF